MMEPTKRSFRKRFLLVVGGLLFVLYLTTACDPSLGTASGNAPAKLPPTPVPTVPTASVSGPMPQITPARLSASMAYDEQRRVVVLFGGSNRNDTWLWDGQAWRQAHPSASPPGRTGASMVYDAARGVIVLFGGVDTTGTPLNDTWTWDGARWSQMHPAQSPSARGLASLAYDVARQDVVLFGGEVMGNGRTSPSASDTWTWDGASWKLLHPTTSPPARFQASMTYDAARQRILLFGGFTTVSAVNDTWTWDGSAWSQQQPATTPPARVGASMVYDSAAGQVVLFAGGAGANVGDLNDTWLWNGANWSRFTTPQAPAGFYTLGAYDPARQAVVAYVVHNDNKIIGKSETWLWNGHVWALYQ